MDSYFYQSTSKKENVMADQKPFEETIVSAINFVLSCTPLNPRCGEALPPLLHLICTTDITQNHEAIIVALEKCIAALPAEWTSILKETIESVLKQKEAAKKFVKYEGFLTLDELASFGRVVHTLLYHEKPAKLSINPPKKESQLCHIAILSDSGEHLDDDFGPNGIFQRCDFWWVKKFTRIPALPEAKKEQSNTITLSNGNTLQFVSGEWWLTEAGDLTSVDQSITKKITRSAVWDLLVQNGILSEVSEEAFKDLNLED